MSTLLVPGFDDLPPADPDDPGAWSPRPMPLPSAFAIAEATRELEAAGNPHDIPEQRREQAFDLAALRAEREARAGEPAAALEACRATFARWLLLPDPGALYVVLAAVLANRAEGDPTWLLVVGPPGGGKTETLNPLAGLRDVHPAATLTEAALLSGTPKREHDAGAKGGLLREIGRFGIVLCKDFGSVLSMNRDARAALLAALREVYDGSWTRHVGTDGGRTLSWEGKVGLIAGCTPAIDSHHAVMGSMGERFVLYRLPPVDADAQARRALSHVGREPAMRRELADAVASALSAADAWRLDQPADEATTERLVSVSTLAVRCRSAVERDSYSREVVLIPEPEAPARMALVLLRLLNGLAALGVDESTRWRLVSKCALDSMPAIRRGVLERLAPRGAETTTAIAEALGYPTTTARRALEDLAAHGVVRRIAEGPGKADRWEMDPWTRERWPGAEAVPGMSAADEGDQAPDAETVPEISGGPSLDGAPEASTVPIPLPIRVYDDISGTVPAPTGVRPPCFGDADLYRSHQHQHHRSGDGWACDVCEASA